MATAKRFTKTTDGIRVCVKQSGFRHILDYAASVGTVMTILCNMDKDKTSPLTRFWNVRRGQELESSLVFCLENCVPITTFIEILCAQQCLVVKHLSHVSTKDKHFAYGQLMFGRKLFQHIKRNGSHFMQNIKMNADILAEFQTFYNTFISGLEHNVHMQISN